MSTFPPAADGPGLRRRRAGEEESALARALDFTRHFAELRSQVRDVPPGPDVEDDYDVHLAALADAAVDDFCDWCVVTVLRPAPHHRIVRASVRVPVLVESDGVIPAALAQRVPDLEALVTRSAMTGLRERVPADVTAGLPWCVVIAIPVHDEVVATVAFVRAVAVSGFGAAELAAADEATWGAATSLERADLLRRARQSSAATLRVAVQLRDLIATSLALSSASDVATIVRELTERTRALFDADEAVVVTDDVDPPIGATARRGEPTTPVADLSLLDGPDARGALRDHNGWLSSPIRGRRDRSLGMIAIRRRDESTSGEDREILALLAQAAASALAAASLNATIRANEARWRVLVESAPIGLIEVALDERVRWWNPAAANIFGWRLFRDTPQASALPEDVLSGLRVLWAEVNAGGLPSGQTLAGVRVGARARDLTVSARRLAGGAEPTMLTLVDDVTDRRQMKEELRHAHTMEIRGQVAGSVVHEFNNLLTIISGYAEILLADLPEGADHDAARAIVETSSRASTLTDQLQTIGRNRVTEPVVLDPVSIIEANAEVLHRVLGSDVTFAWTGPAQPVHVRVDADQFEQLVLNLAINARDAMPDGGTLEVDVSRRPANEIAEAHHLARSGDYVVISVADTGFGMDDETRERCFEPFFTTKGPFKGTGLGLSAARRFVEESHGSIECTSELGVGTTFEVVLPVVDAPADTHRDVAAVVPTRSAIIVIAEDDDVQRRLATAVLARNGHRVFDVASAEAARDAVLGATEPVDLLVSDVIMGVTAGDAVAGELQRALPALRVLLVSGTATASVLEGLDASRSDFLAKPFRPSELVERVRRLLEVRDGV